MSAYGCDHATYTQPRCPWSWTQSTGMAGHNDHRIATTRHQAASARASFTGKQATLNP